MVRWIPTSLYNVPAVETWLQDQARRGRHLTGFLGNYLATFEKGAPREDTYRLEVSRGGFHPDEEAEALYAAAGWTYVGLAPNSDFWVFRSALSDPAPIHTDPEVQAIGYRRLQRRLRRRSWGYFLGLAILLVLIAIWSRLLPVRRMVEDPALLVSNLPVLLAAYVFYSVLAVSDLLHLKRLLNTLRAGVPMEHRGRARKLRPWGFRALMLAVPLYFVLGFFSISSQGFRQDFLDWRGPLADCPEPLPYVSVESLGAVPRKPSPSAAAYRSALASAVYTVRDGDATYPGWGGIVSGHEGWEDVRRQGRTECWHLALPGLAGPLARELVREELPEGAERLADGRFDGVWYAVDDAGGQHLVLRQGRRVLWMRAEVPADLRDHLADFAAALERVP